MVIKQAEIFSVNENINLKSKYEKTGFRPIHYLGSKLRLLDKIEEAIDSIAPKKGRVVDLFAGSGTVSSYLAKTRPVISVDIQHYSGVLCSALLKTDISNRDYIHMKSDFIRYIESNESLLIFQELFSYENEAINKAIRGDYDNLVDLLENGSIIGLEQGYSNSDINVLKELLNKVIIISKNIDEIDTLVLRYFGGIYFSYYQGAQIDLILKFIHENIEEHYRDLYIAALLSATSEIVNTIGKQFAQPLKPTDSSGRVKKSIVKTVQRDRHKDIVQFFLNNLDKFYENISYSNENEVYIGDSAVVMNSINNATVVYADPPYTRYHYSRYYHVLETIALRDIPTITKIKKNGVEKLSRGIYRDDRYQSSFSIKSKSIEAFDKLFASVSSKGLPLVLSYSPFEKSDTTAPRVVTLENIKKIARKYYKSVEVELFDDINHSKLNNASRINEEKVKNAEMLIICEKRWEE